MGQAEAESGKLKRGWLMSIVAFEYLKDCQVKRKIYILCPKG